MNPLIVPLKICPVAPTGVAAYTDQISGMVLWSVLWLFGIAALVSVGAILVGRATHSPHLSKGGIIGLAGVLALGAYGFVAAFQPDANFGRVLAAYGGVFVAGGIVPRFPQFIAASDFRARFEAKGRFQDYLRDIPTRLVVKPDASFDGLKMFAAHNRA